MEEIIQKFSPPMSDELVGEKIFPKKIFPSYPQKIFDLHGYTRDEIPAKIQWILDYSHQKYFERIRIITGVGKNILFSTSLQVLKKLKNKYSLIHIIPSEGVIEVYISS